MSNEIKFAILLVALFAIAYLLVIGGLAIYGGLSIMTVLTAWQTKMYIAISLLAIAGLLLLQAHFMGR